MFYGILLLLICIVGLFCSGRRGGCDICGTDFKRTSYSWTIRGRQVRLCPTCSGKMDRKKSKLAFNPDSEIEVPLIPERPPDRRGVIISMLVLLGIGFFVWSSMHGNGGGDIPDMPVTNEPPDKPTPSATPAPPPLPSEISLTKTIRPTPSATPASPPLPSEIALTTSIRMPITINGSPSGTITLPVGTRVRLVSVHNGSVVIRYADSVATVPLTFTDLHLSRR